MAEKLVVGPVGKGLRTGITAFNIDNDAFAKLVNAYQWRGRVKRKRGTGLLGRLRRYFNSNSTSYGSISTFNLVAGAGNILTSFSLQSNGNIEPGSVHLTVGANAYTDPGLSGVLVGAPGGSGTINYATGAITIAGGAGSAVTLVSFQYYPDLPVLGLEDVTLGINQSPGTMGFDKTYAYNILTVEPYSIYDISFYKNPSTAAYTGYTTKTTVTPTSWNGQDYQQFWTVNYQGALWATNGINVPFKVDNVGMQFKPILTVDNITAGPPAFADLGITAHGLVVGDFVFVNEVLTTTGINWQTGYVTAVVNANKVTVEFPNATITTAGTGGICQYLTNRSDTTKDCIRWYDGDPTDGNITTPTLNGKKGWVNFQPPLSQSAFSISDLPAKIYYLVGARIIVPYKDRLLFFGPVVQASTGAAVYLQDTVVYSQNGTPYYTVSYTNSPSPTVDTPTNPITFNEILVPANQTATPSAFFSDSTGFGGFISAGVDQAINTVYPNEDVLIIGFDRMQSRFVFTGNDIVPFNFFTVNSELGSSSTFSGITLDRGVITRGNRGIVMANQTGTERIDLEIPDQVFEFNLLNNGTERVTAQRDFVNEWAYITYLSNQHSKYKFPNQTLFYNYRDHSWAIFDEAYTTYGQFKRKTGFIWSTVGLTYPTWTQWTDPWNSGNSTVLQPQIIAGNQQGFVIFRDQGIGEADSLYIQSFSANTITSPDHCLNEGDYIIINDCLGTIGPLVNGRIFSVSGATQNTFKLNPAIGSSTYLGNGTIKRLYRPDIQTRQFPTNWGDARKTRIGVQQYLFTGTDTGQIQLLIFLSQNSSYAYNKSRIVPATGSTNKSLIYSTVLYTCPESTNIGLTPANTNLQMVTADAQDQIWHRINTSLLGDTVQLGFTLSDEQMRSLTASDRVATITGATQANPCVLTVNYKYDTGLLLEINGVVGMTELNGNTYNVVSSTDTTVTIEVDSTAFTAYASGGTATPVSPINQFSEIELHGFILECSPSMVLA